MKIFIIILLINTVFLVADTDLRIMSYNALKFPSESGSSRLDDFQTVFSETYADVILMQEIESTGGADMILNTLNEEQEQYSRANYVYDGEMSNILYYRTSKAQLISQGTVYTSPRNISRYVLQVENSIIYFFCCHLKSSQGTDNEEERLEAVQDLRDHLETLPAATEFVIAGDMNFYEDSEPAYQKFIADEVNNDGRSQDLCTQVGSWHNNYTYREVHTQSARENQFGGGVGGGMDDKFDFIFTSYDLNDGSGLEFVQNSFVVIGNDGNHFNQSVNDGYNSAVSSDVADALYYASDHLPVIADFVVLENSLTIADIQTTDDGEEGPSPLTGQIVDISGIVSAVCDNGCFIQDNPGGWNGIFVYDNSFATAYGDEISLIGEVDEYYDKTEIRNIQNLNINSAGNQEYEAVIEQTGNIGQEMYEGVLVTVLNAECTDDDAGYGEWIVDDGSGEILIGDLMFSFQPVIGEVYDITGVADFSFDDFKIEPRDSDDILQTAAEDNFLEKTEYISVFPNPFHSQTTISFCSEQNKQNELNIYNITGQKIKTFTIDQSTDSLINQIIWDGTNNADRTVSSGIYFIKFSSGNENMIKKAMLIK